MCSEGEKKECRSREGASKAALTEHEPYVIWGDQCTREGRPMPQMGPVLGLAMQGQYLPVDSSSIPFIVCFTIPHTALHRKPAK